MDQSVINLAQAKRQELLRRSRILSRQQNHQRPKLDLFPQLKENIAQGLISLGTRLQGQSPVSSPTLMSPPQNSWQGQ